MSEYPWREAMKPPEPGWTRSEFSLTEPTDLSIELTADDYVWIAPAGKPRLRYRIAVWLRKLDRRDPLRHYQPLGFIDDVAGVPVDSEEKETPK